MEITGHPRPVSSGTIKLKMRIFCFLLKYVLRSYIKLSINNYYRTLKGRICSFPVDSYALCCGAESKYWSSDIYFCIQKVYFNFLVRMD